MAKAKKEITQPVAQAAAEPKYPVVRNIQNNFFYLYLGGNKFMNLITEQEGEVDPEKAKDLFVLNCEATIVLNEFPLAKELIRALGLKFDNNKK